MSVREFNRQMANARRSGESKAQRRDERSQSQPLQSDKVDKLADSVAQLATMFGQFAATTTATTSGQVQQQPPQQQQQPQEGAPRQPAVAPSLPSSGGGVGGGSSVYASRITGLGPHDANTGLLNIFALDIAQLDMLGPQGVKEVFDQALEIGRKRSSAAPRPIPPTGPDGLQAHVQIRREFDPTVSRERDRRGR